MPSLSPLSSLVFNSFSANWNKRDDVWIVDAKASYCSDPESNLRLCSHYMELLFLAPRKTIRDSVNSHIPGRHMSFTHIQHRADGLVETVWCSNFLPSLLNIYFLLNGFQSSLLLIYFREGPNRCSHYSKVMHKTYPLRDLHFRDRRGSPVKLCFSIKVIATEFFSTPFNGWMAI